jgi:predicted RNase H-like HicB family nuclease
MPKLPGINHLQAVNALQKAGFSIARQSKHIVMTNGIRFLTIPRNNPINTFTEDQTYVAEVPELAGCVAHGESQEAALNQANQAADLWITTTREFGDPIPEPKGRRLALA